MLLPGKDAAIEIERHLLGVKGGDAEIAGDAVEKRGIGRADNINLALQILSADAKSRHDGDLSFDTPTDATAGNRRSPLIRDCPELRLVKHGAAHARVGDHPKF